MRGGLLSRLSASHDSGWCQCLLWPAFAVARRGGVLRWRGGGGCLRSLQWVVFSFWFLVFSIPASARWFTKSVVCKSWFKDGVSASSGRPSRSRGGAAHCDGAGEADVCALCKPFLVFGLISRQFTKSVVCKLVQCCRPSRCRQADAGVSDWPLAGSALRKQRRASLQMEPGRAV